VSEATTFDPSRVPPFPPEAASPPAPAVVPTGLEPRQQHVDFTPTAEVGFRRMNNVGWLGLGAVMSSLLAGCGAPVEGESDAADAPHAAEDVGSVQEALGARDVGVIPVETNACPAGTEVSFRLDVEDGEDLVIGCEPGPEGGYISRWVTRDVVWNQAPIASYMCGGNFTMRFCRVDGTQFKKLLWANQSTAYAVLQLGSSCPDGASALAATWIWKTTTTPIRRAGPWLLQSSIAMPI
jgi:hypothetical protein